MITLDALNAMSAADFAVALEGVFEHAPWVAGAAAPARPFASVAALHEAMMAVVLARDEAGRREFLGRHPPLSATALADPGLTAHSREEQQGLALASLAGEAAGFAALAQDYAQRTGIPFIICARRHSARSVLRELRRRIALPVAGEVAVALEEVRHISRLRLVARVSGPGVPATTGQVSVHLEDGRAVPFTLACEGLMLGRFTTGQVALGDAPLRIGGYEALVEAASFGAAIWGEAIALRFAVDAPEGSYRLDLSVGPDRYTLRITR